MGKKETVTIAMDDASAAYYKGVAAGIDVQEAMAAEWTGQPVDVQRCVYWLLVGRRSADITEQKRMESFTMGAAIRQPTANTADGSLWRYVARQSADIVKRDLELYCTECDEHLCDMEPSDTLASLVGVAQDHEKAAHS